MRREDAASRPNTILMNVSGLSPMVNGSSLLLVPAVRGLLSVTDNKSLV
jgi:hypothetical protein